MASLVVDLLGQPVSEDQPLMEAGLDSLGALELCNALSSKYSLDLPASLVFDYPNITSLSSFLAASIRPAQHALRSHAISSVAQTPDVSGADVIGLACQYPSTDSGNISLSLFERVSI